MEVSLFVTFIMLGVLIMYDECDIFVMDFLMCHFVCSRLLES